MIKKLLAIENSFQVPFYIYDHHISFTYFCAILKISHCFDSSFAFRVAFVCLNDWLVD